MPALDNNLRTCGVQSDRFGNRTHLFVTNDTNTPVSIPEPAALTVPPYSFTFQGEGKGHLFHVNGNVVWSEKCGRPLGNKEGECGVCLRHHTKEATKKRNAELDAQNEQRRKLGLPTF